MTNKRIPSCLTLNAYYSYTYKRPRYDYFVDRWQVTDDGGAVTSWYKPILARTNDIKVEEFFDPDDHMADGSKYSYKNFETGPYLRQGSLGQGNVTRVPQKVCDWCVCVFMYIRLLLCFY